MIGGEDIGNRERLFLDSGLRCEQMTAVDAGQEAAGDWWGQKAAVFLDHHVLDGALGDFAAFVEEESIVETGGAGLLVDAVIERPVCSFVAKEAVGGIGWCGWDEERDGMG